MDPFPDSTESSVLKYLSLGTHEVHDICEYPDSNKVGVFSGEVGNRHLRKMFRVDEAVDYFDGES